MSTRAGSAVRTLAGLGFVVTAVGLITSFVTPFLPLFLSRELRAGPGLVSLFLFGMPLAAVVVSTAIGRISDRPNARPRLLIVAAVAGAGGFALFAVLRGYWASLAVALTLLAVAASLVPQIFAFSRSALDRSYPTRAAAGVNVLRSLLSLAWVAGPPLAAFLIGVVDFRGLFLVAAVLYLAILPVLLGFRRADLAGPPTEPGDADHHDLDAHEAREAREAHDAARATLRWTSAAFILLQCAGVLGVMSMSLFVSEDLHREIGDAGLILGLCAALEIPLMLLLGALATRWSLRGLVLAGAGAGVVYFAAMTLTDSVWAVAAAQLLNAGFIAATGGLGISYFQDLMPTRLGRATTMFTNSNRLSAMLAGLIFGVVQVAGYRVAYLIGTGLCVLGLALLALIRPARAVPVRVAEAAPLP